MYVDNGVVEIICSVIMNMEKSLEDYHHELFLSTLNQLLRMSPTRVKDICAKVEDFKLSLLALRDSYPNNSNYQACYIDIYLRIFGTILCYCPPRHLEIVQ